MAFTHFLGDTKQSANPPSASVLSNYPHITQINYFVRFSMSFSIFSESFMKFSLIKIDRTTLTLKFYKIFYPNNRQPVLKLIFFSLKKKVSQSKMPLVKFSNFLKNVQNRRFVKKIPRSQICFKYKLKWFSVFYWFSENVPENNKNYQFGHNKK